MQKNDVNGLENTSEPVKRLTKSSYRKRKYINHEKPFEFWEEFTNNKNNDIYPKYSTNIENNKDDNGIKYPEIIWYHISRFLKPESIRTFALINRATSAVVKRESFWRNLYFKYCDQSLLPDNLLIDRSGAVSGIRHRVIRALYESYTPFQNIASNVCYTIPVSALNRRCISVWSTPIGKECWILYIKLKRMLPGEEVPINIVDKLSSIGADSEEFCQVLQLTCLSLNEVPPLMGMALTYVRMRNSMMYSNRKLYMKFNDYNSGREISLIVHDVATIIAYDWWHPLYPYEDNKSASPSKNLNFIK